MIDLKALRSDPETFRRAVIDKNVDVDIDVLLDLDTRRRRIISEQETMRAEQNRLGKSVGPEIGRLKRAIRQAGDDERPSLEREVEALEERPAALKRDIQALDGKLTEIEPAWRDLWLKVPQPADPDVPRGASADDNVQLRTWAPTAFDPIRSFIENKGFAPRTHIELLERLRLADFERGVKMGGARHYVLTGDGAVLHQAVLRFALDMITNEFGFSPMTVPVIVREEAMVGTGFFPTGRDQAYHVAEAQRGSGQDLYLVGTGEVPLMGFHGDEILDPATLPLKYATVSTCFRREAGAAGKDTAGLYRIHQFEKVEQVVISRADEAESRRHHQAMIEIVETLLQRLELPYRLLQCCTGDLGVKNADMIDAECWMPGRGETDADGRPLGAYGETHSASRLYDYQCRRLNMRYRDDDGKTVFCHSLNNTVVASPRILIPILEIHQNADGSVTIPVPLRPYCGGRESIP